MSGIQSLPMGHFWFFFGAFGLLSLLALYYAFRNLNRARIIEDTPTARIRSAHQGYVELVGEAALMRGEPILSPLTQTRCCWYRYRIEKKFEKGWRTLRSGTSEGLFLLRDATGECIINPDNATLTPRSPAIWYGSTPTPPEALLASPSEARLGLAGAILEIGSKLATNARYRYTEETIQPGEQLYAIGLFKTFGEADRLAMRDELIKERLSQWKADHAALLDRFDRDGDGRIDLGEWEVARRTAKREVTLEQLKQPDHSLHTLSDTGSRSRPFLISTKQELVVVKGYRRLAFAALSGFFIVGAGGVWMLVVRFGGLLS